jgi:hypothetical protein
MIVWLVDRKVHDTDSSIQSVDVAFDLKGFVSCAVPNVVPLSSCPACHSIQLEILQKPCSQKSLVEIVSFHCESSAIEVVIPPKLNDVHILHSGHVPI